MIFLLIAAALFVLDFRIKTQIEAKDASFFPARILRGKASLERLHNRGVMLNGLENHPRKVAMLTRISFLLLAIVSLFTFFRKSCGLLKTGFALILGGAAGNLFDRLGRGYVVDYLRFDIKPLKRIVLNLSDLFIFLGSIFILISGLFDRK